MKSKIVLEFKRYNWTVDYSIIEVSDNFYRIMFPNCFIEYYKNQMYHSIECCIDIDGKKYDLETALRFNKRKTGYLYNNHSDLEIARFIEQYTETLYFELLHFIIHDFSWADRANKSLGL